MAAQFQFVVRTGPNAGKTFPLEAAEISVGRDNSNGVPINDAEVSRKHARLILKGSGYVLEDLGSTNGTFVNGNRLSGSIPLKSGDTVSFGENIVLIYEALIDVNATMISSGKAARTSASVQPPAPAPASAPAPAPAYSGQVPAGPAPTPAAPKKSSSRVVVIVLIAVLLCLILACVAVLLWVDADKTGARWCIFPFKIIAQLFGAVCQ